MSTEYRRGIPSTAHVEAATRLGLLWGDNYSLDRRWHFEIRDGVFHSDFESSNVSLGGLRSGQGFWMPPAWVDLRPIRPDGTLVDWEVLDAEVARAGLQGQPQGFRADLWRRICAEFNHHDEAFSLKDINAIDVGGSLIINGYARTWSQPFGPGYDGILARWTVYQELKPLYDLVDGAQGEAAMPRDVYNECRARAGWTGEADDRWLLRYNSRLEAVGIGEVWHGDGCTLFERANMRNFAAVLDAVAERRVAERMRGQTPANPNAILTVTSAQRSNVEPRRFADVRPDRHGWRWWRLVSAPGCTAINGSRFEAANEQWRWLAMADGAAPTGPLVGSHIWTHVDSIWNLRTVIPTDEQGNSVSWEAAGFAAEAMRFAQETVQRAANDAIPSRSAGDIEWTLPRPSQFSNNPATPPLTPEGFQQVLETVQMAPGLYQETLDWVTRQVLAGPVIGVDTAKAPPITTLPLPLPRFTADELDDVDHSKTTKLDEVMLRRGKLPTVEQIAKYREVRTKRTGGAVADALKESRIDCEVAQYVLERWAGGLGDELALWLLRAVGKYSRSDLRFTQRSVDELAQRELTHEAGAIETAESSPAVQRERLEAEERRQRLTELRQRLAAERAAQPQETAKESDVSRFDLIEPDPQADPSASIRAWEARQAATKVCHTAAPPRIAKPAAAPRRPAIEVVDAEVDGLSRSEAFAALFGRALNGGC